MSSAPAIAPPAAGIQRGRSRHADRSAKYVFLLPAIIYLLILGVFPLLFSVYMVFASWQGGSREITWVGFDNIQRLMNDNRFWHSLRLTMSYVALAAGLELVLGFMVALALQGASWGKNSLRLLFALPMLLPPIAVSFTWRMLFDFNRGPLNHALENLGLEPVTWLAGQQTAILSLVIVDVWQWTPFVALAVLAAMESLPPELYESATVDGASTWSLLRDITLPLLKPYIVAVVLLRAIDAFKIFDTVFILTGGGPGTATEVLTFYAHVAGFRPFNMGFTATVAWAMVIVMTVIFFFYLRIFRRIQED
ncbi:MAG: sugar ABC transporter permease [Chloroflexota bacterium]|nr:sugar ABC transporter permease [Chloroflexota bacterium]